MLITRLYDNLGRFSISRQAFGSKEVGFDTPIFLGKELRISNINKTIYAQDDKSEICVGDIIRQVVSDDDVKKKVGNFDIFERLVITNDKYCLVVM